MKSSNAGKVRVERLVERVIRFYADPAIGFPWLGKRGLVIAWRLERGHGFGVWVQKDRHWSHRTIFVALWWIVRIERVYGPCW